jgi:hypothetical protein
MGLGVAAFIILMGIVFYSIFGKPGVGALLLLLLGSCIIMRTCS